MRAFFSVPTQTNTVPEYPAGRGSDTHERCSCCRSDSLGGTLRCISSRGREVVHIPKPGGTSTTSVRVIEPALVFNAMTMCRRTRLPPSKGPRHQMGFSRKGAVTRLRPLLATTSSQPASKRAKAIHWTLLLPGQLRVSAGKIGPRAQGARRAINVNQAHAQRPQSQGQEVGGET